MKTIRDGDALWLPPAETGSKFWLKLSEDGGLFTASLMDSQDSRDPLASVFDNGDRVFVESDGLKQASAEEVRSFCHAIGFAANIAADLQTWKDTYKQEMERSPALSTIEPCTCMEEIEQS